MTPAEAEASVLSGDEVRAFYGSQIGDTHAIGRIVAFCNAPQVLIEKPDGSRLWWRMDLTEATKRNAHNNHCCATCEAHSGGAHRDHQPVPG